MKKIVLKNIKKLLVDIQADTSTAELILNNVQLYNDLVKEYHEENTKHNAYLLYQLNNQIIKQIESIKKLNKKLNVEPADNFTNTIGSIKKKFETR